MMIYKRLAGAAAVLALAGAGLLGLASPAQAQGTESFAEAGPVDLSGSGHATGNVGERATVGTVELGGGEWTVTASVRLFVPDPEPEASNDGKWVGLWKNSQGCGLYAAGEQLGGVGGSSNLWSATTDGKEVVFSTFLVPPDWTDVPIVIDGPATVELECFIDQSHSGAALAEREGMAATDIAIEATRTPEPSPTPSASPTPTPTEPAAAGKGGSDGDASLPVTGASVPLFMAAGAGLLGLGGGLAGLAWWLRRRQRAALLGGLAE